MLLSVDSSLTEWKQEMGNTNDPESLSYKNNEDRCTLRTQRVGHEWVESSSISKRDKLYATRYFIIKSLNHQNIQLSVEKGIWATQVMNEPILEEAFHSSSKVILIFSVNTSGFFQGYAQMMSSIGWRHDNIWSQASGKNNPWGRSFKVKWLRLRDLPFQKTLRLKNPLNDYKPVKISRDCQELPEDIGQALCELIDGEDAVGGTLKSAVVDDPLSKRPYIEPSCSLGDGGYNLPPLHMPRARRPMPYPSFMYQPPSESESPIASTPTDEDLLEMTYEEYLEVHSRGVKQLNMPMAGPSYPSQESSRSKKSDDEPGPSFVHEKSRPRKRTRHSSEK